MSTRALDASWLAWLEENLARGCNPVELVDILRKNDFSLKSVKDAMGDRFPVQREPLAAASERSYQAIASPALVRNPRAKKVETNLLQIYTIDDFVSPAECAALVQIISENLRPSTVTTDEKDKTFRTSTTCDLSNLDRRIVGAIDERIGYTLGIRPEYSELTQAQRYDVGQQFKAHTDFFEPGTKEYMQFGGPRGNRTWTFMVYLNDGMTGGGTKFWRIGRVFEPKLGQAVVWNNLHADGTVNRDSIHSGEPVLSGHKIIITKWFREIGSGPMFY